MKVLGRPYSEALRLLREAGEYPFRILLSTPPGGRLGLKTLRVIRERRTEGRLELVLAYEDYEKKRGARERGASCLKSGGSERGGTPRKD